MTESTDATPRPRLSIAVTNPFCWPWVRRGSERMLHDLSSWLAAQGHEVTIIATGPVDALTESVDDGVRRLVYPQYLTGSIGDRLSLLHVFAVQVNHAIRRHRFDAVYCLNYHDAAGVAAVPAARRPRLVMHFVGIPVGRYFWTRPLDWLMCRLALRRADGVATLSQAAQMTLRRDLGFSSHILPSPVNTAAFGTHSKLPAGRDPVILFVGDTTEIRKGARPLALAFEKLREAHPTARLRFSGKSDAATERAIVEDLAPTTRAAVEFMGLGKVDDLPRHYTEATVFALPATWEAFGIVFVEALASGTPVVGCRHGGVTDILVDPQVGILVEPGATRPAMSNIEGLAAALEAAIALAQDPATAGRCRNHASRFSWERLGPYFEALLQAPPSRLASLPTPPPPLSPATIVWPRVSIVVPTWRRPRLLERAIESLLRQDYPADRLEVIVVHREDGDGTAEIVERLARDTRVSLRRIMTLHQGPGGSRHDGAMQSSGDIIAFIDDDCAATPEWVRSGVIAMDGGIGLVQGRTLPNPAQPRRMLERTIQIEGPTALYETCNIFYRRKAFMDVGGFSPEFRDGFLGEDTDLGWKVRQAGWPTAYAPSAEVHHEVFAVGLLTWLAGPKLYAVWPKLVKRYPALRDELFFRFFLSRNSALFDLGVFGVLLAMIAHPAAAALTIPYLYTRYREVGRFGRRTHRIARVLAGIPRASVGLASLILASIRNRCPVL